MAEAVHPDSPNRLINRELSWLDFNRRVLVLAGEPSTPLLSRLFFCGVWATNLDEYFQVRIAGLLSDQATGGRVSVDGMTTSAQLSEIRLRLAGQMTEAHRVLGGIIDELAVEGIDMISWDSLERAEQKALTEVFADRIFPVLTPLAVDPGHPFPYISSLSLSLAVLVRDPLHGDHRFARVKVPTEMLGRHVRVPDTDQFVLLEDVIAANLDQLFPGMEILDFGLFRVSRDADLDIDEREVDDLMSAVESELRQRRFGSIVRLEINSALSPEIRSRLVQELGITESLVYEVDGHLDLGTLAQLPPVDRPDLQYPKWEPRTPAVLGDDDGPKDFFAVLRGRDVLVHHPYVSFHTSVLEFIRQATADPAVLAIKVTLYRTSGDGRIVDALLRAAESGKQVVVIFELKARFDEEANIEGAKRLERAGAHVTYGLVGLKVHSKVALVVRRDSDGEVRRYCHLGTGNYNSRTARNYTDLGLLTSDPSIGADLSRFFNTLTGYGVAPEYERILVAPEQMRARLIELIRNEASYGEEGRIVAKMNSLVDPIMIDELYGASTSRVPIDLIVRGICCLRPGVPGLSETISVRSILGRWLEHSRVYFFANGNGPDMPLYLIGSADLMPRNLNRRVEVLVPVDTAARQDEIELILGVNLADDMSAWELMPDGAWVRVQTMPAESGGCVRTHDRLQDLTA